MIKLLLAGLIAAMIAGGVYLYKEYDSKEEAAEQTGNQLQNSLDAIEGAKDAVNQQEQRAEDIQQKAQDAVQSPYNY